MQWRRAAFERWWWWYPGTALLQHREEAGTAGMMLQVTHPHVPEQGCEQSMETLRTRGAARPM